jgi:hypothetical protein
MGRESCVVVPGNQQRICQNDKSLNLKSFILIFANRRGSYLLLIDIFCQLLTRTIAVTAGGDIEAGSMGGEICISALSRKLTAPMFHISAFVAIRSPAS